MIFKTAIIFAIPAFIAVYLTRKYILPAIPDEIGEIGDFLITKDIAIMLFFAIVMLVSSVTMIRGSGANCKEEEAKVIYNIPLIIFEGFVVGVITGLVGAGGGFFNNSSVGNFSEVTHEKSSSYIAVNHCNKNH